jgi:hypothetical protein
VVDRPDTKLDIRHHILQQASRYPDEADYSSAKSSFHLCLLPMVDHYLVSYSYPYIAENVSEYGTIFI